MMTFFFRQGAIKFAVGWLVCLAIRLIPFRPPNVEPLTATIMPFSQKFGKLGGFFFGVLSIVIFDFLTGKLGVWTIVTGVAYGLLGVGAGLFLTGKRAGTLGYLKYAVIGTVLYDAVTGLSIGPLVFGQSFTESLIGQIPFTARHLLSNIILSITLSPLINRWVVENENLEPRVILAKFSRPA